MNQANSVPAAYAGNTYILYLQDRFFEIYRQECTHCFAAPGRSELGGNHTDHQNGHVLACAVNLYIRAAAARNGSEYVFLYSEDYGMTRVSVLELESREEEKNTTAALMRGILSAFRDRGVQLSGLDIYVKSEVPAGSGLSSSAAFEVLFAKIVDTFFNEERLEAPVLARIGQYAENVYFGKPCGLMDQTACAVGGAVGIDFLPEEPVIEKTALDFSAYGYGLCIIDSGAGHADLTEEYAAIPAEMRNIAGFFEKKVLGEVEETQFLEKIGELRERFGDRAVLRAYHFFTEDKRAREEFLAVKEGRFADFLRLVKASGDSSFKNLQNIVPAGSTLHQEMAIALMTAEHALAGTGGVCRVHGGGFAGTIQAFVPLERMESFIRRMETVLGRGCCKILQVENEGVCAYSLTGKE